jgi:hypothetical protein
MLLLAMPAGATLVLSGSTLTPPGLPLATLREQKVDVKITIIPSGERTFAIGHRIQMETGLADARWSTIVFVDGYTGDRESSTGRVAFINGFVLSYPTDRDVSVGISVSGTVPDNAGPSVRLLTVRELDNSGQAVPGSMIMISEPVSTPAPVPAAETTTEATTPPPSPSPSPAPTRAAGFTFLTGLFAAGSLVTAGRLYRRDGKPL